MQIFTFLNSIINLFVFTFNFCVNEKCLYRCITVYIQIFLKNLSFVMKKPNKIIFNLPLSFFIHEGY